MSDTSGSDHVSIVGDGAADWTSSVTNHASSAADMQQALLAVLQSIEQDPTDKTLVSFAVEFGAASAEELLIDAASVLRESGIVQEIGPEANQRSHVDGHPQDTDSGDSGFVLTGANDPEYCSRISATDEFGIASLDELLVASDSLGGDEFSSDAPDIAANGHRRTMSPPADESPQQSSFDPLAIKVLFGEDGGAS